MSGPGPGQRVASAATRGIAIAIALAGAAIYLPGLASTPMYPTPDEVKIALAAHSISTTGHDTHGGFLPLYFQVEAVSWYQPAAIYLQALTFKFIPFGILAVRLPTAVLGILNAVLMYALGLRVFKSRGLAIAAALMLLLAPAHFIHSRLGLDYLYPLPAIIAWLLCLAIYDERPASGPLVVAGLILGIGFYTYISAVFLMPAFLLVTVAWLFSKRSPFAHYVALASAFALPMVCLLVWLVGHPTALSDTVQRYTLYNTAHAGPLQGAREFFSYTNLSARLSMYWAYLSPLVLFVDAVSPPLFTVRGYGMLLIEAGVFFVAGLYRVVSSPGAGLNAVWMTGVLLAPMVAVLVDELAVQRLLPILPFVVVLSAIGLKHLWQVGNPPRLRPVLLVGGSVLVLTGAAYLAITLARESRMSGSAMPLILGGGALCAVGWWYERLRLGAVVALGLLAMMPVQFAGFHGSYLSTYRSRSREAVFGNVPGALERVIEQDSAQTAPKIYLSADIPLVGDYWAFITLSRARESMSPKSVEVAPSDFSATAIPIGSLVLARLADAPMRDAESRGELRLVERIPEPENGPLLYVLYRR